MTEDEVEAVCLRWYGRKWNGSEAEAPGPKMKEIWRGYARKAIEAIDKVRASSR